MANVWRFNYDAAAANAMFRDPQGGLSKDLSRRGRAVESKAKLIARVDTGRLRASVTSRIAVEGGLPVSIVGSNVQYAHISARGRPLGDRPFLLDALDAAAS